MGALGAACVVVQATSAMMTLTAKTNGNRRLIFCILRVRILSQIGCAAELKDTERLRSGPVSPRERQTLDLWQAQLGAVATGIFIFRSAFFSVG
jgi:hypothetical protein